MHIGHPESEIDYGRGEEMRKLNLVLQAVFVFSLFATDANSQDHCGVSCPVCTGDLKTVHNDSGKYTGLVPHGNFSWFSIYVPESHGEEDEKGSTSLTVGLFDRFEGGLTLGIDSWDLRGRGKVLLFREGRITPGIIAGIGNIRPSGVETNGYLMLNKGAKLSGLPIHCYLGVAKKFDVDEVEEFYGLSVGVAPNFGAMAGYDGKEFHIGAAIQPIDRLNVGVMLLDGQDFSVFSNFSGQIPSLNKN